jgi:DNA adenine methylase
MSSGVMAPFFILSEIDKYNYFMKTPISYYGWKQTMLKHLVPLIPPHEVYTESFAGGAALFFAKDPAPLEVINDINQNLITFYKVFKDRYVELNERIQKTLHSRETYNFAMIVYDNPLFFDEVVRAWAVWVLSKMGFASKLVGSFGYDRTSNSICKKIKFAREAFTLELSKRLENTQIECTSAFKVIESRDCEDALHFVDPPYINSDCGHYTDTFNLADFERLLEILSNVKGKFMLTMFPHEVLSEYIKMQKWRVLEVERTISASKVNRRKQVELIISNF